MSKLHVLNWAIRTDENRTMLRRVIHGDVFPDTVVVRIEPSLNRALDFARGEGLVKYVAGNRVQLTPQGTDAADRLVQREGLFVKERQFLEELGKNGLTEKLVSDLFAEG